MSKFAMLMIRQRPLGSLFILYWLRRSYKAKQTQTLHHLHCSPLLLLFLVIVSLTDSLWFQRFTKEIFIIITTTAAAAAAATTTIII